VRPDCCTPGRPAAAGKLDADLHEQRSGFVAQFFPIFLLGALFGKLMEASGSFEAIAKYLTERLGTKRAMLAIVLAGAFVTYGGVSLFVAFFVLAPMGHALFKAANIPHRLMPAAIALGTSTVTMSAMPGTPAIQNAIPMPFFGTNPFAAPGLGLTASAIMLEPGEAGRVVWIFNLKTV
jgi:H+/gluconate symporter-like permease